MRVPIDAHWANDHHTIIHIHYSEHWTWDDFEVFDLNLNALLDSADRPVAALTDARGTGVPVDVFSHFQRLRTGAIVSHPNLAVNVIVVSNRLLLNIIQSFVRLYRLEQASRILVATYEEAEEIVAMQAAQLSKSLA